MNIRYIVLKLNRIQCTVSVIQTFERGCCILGYFVVRKFVNRIGRQSVTNGFIPRIYTTVSIPEIVDNLLKNNLQLTCFGTLCTFLVSDENTIPINVFLYEERVFAVHFLPPKFEDIPMPVVNRRTST